LQGSVAEIFPRNTMHRPWSSVAEIFPDLDIQITDMLKRGNTSLNCS
jgi:hypothetical protein